VISGEDHRYLTRVLRLGVGDRLVLVDGVGTEADARILRIGPRALELLAEQPRGSVLDVGCGSGVLAIAAAKLGFGPVAAGDNDPVALEVTRENAERNGVTVDTVTLVDARTDALAADVVVANIALDVVESLVPRVRCRRLVLSGYLAGEGPAAPGFAHVARREASGWAADAYAPE
jgi:ribosomal protein L11 methyltransferase